MEFKYRINKLRVLFDRVVYLFLNKNKIVMLSSLKKDSENKTTGVMLLTTHCQLTKTSNIRN